MVTEQIWEHANQHRELVRALYRAICAKKDIDVLMTQLKQVIPCLYGVDAERRALVFQSTNEGLVALNVQEEGDTMVLALETGITLE